MEELPENQKRKPKSKRVVVSSEDEGKHADSKKPELTASSSLCSSSSSKSDIQPARKKKEKQAPSSKGSIGQSGGSDFKPSKKGKHGRRDASASPDSGKANKMKRRLIKVAAFTEDKNSDDSVEILNSSQETGNQSRKNLRKLQPVGDETRVQEECKKRVQERQKLDLVLNRDGTPVVRLRKIDEETKKKYEMQTDQEEAPSLEGPAETFSCGDCDSVFASLEYLQRHREKMHGRRGG
ncbi:unnamed protein product, partial [Ixodes persulcatus]